VRIDDRLLHGQVAQGWAAVLNSKLIVIANDEVAGDEWLSGLYSDAAPPETRVEVLGVNNAARRFAEFEDDELAAIVLLKDVFDAVRLAESEARVKSVNVGGMHYEDGKRELLPYLFVDERDETALRRLIQLGLNVEAQDVPGGRCYSVAELLEVAG
jgi:mannose/fructose/N-acetylgalactosamine-specific phosphotransferase system component IIB